MIKKINAYQTRDGKTFAGKGAKEKAQNHQRELDLEEKVKDVVKYARDIFKIPDSEDYDLEDDEADKELDFLDAIHADTDFDALIKCIISMKAYDSDGFDDLIHYIKTGNRFFKDIYPTLGSCGKDKDLDAHAEMLTKKRINTK